MESQHDLSPLSISVEIALAAGRNKKATSVNSGEFCEHLTRIIQSRLLKKIQPKSFGSSVAGKRKEKLGHYIPVSRRYTNYEVLIHFIARRTTGWMRSDLSLVPKVGKATLQYYEPKSKKLEYKKEGSENRKVGRPPSAVSVKDHTLE